ncbi:hypothetical protein SLEP1_g51920 [Rubroshorea leprosula]|uniref:Integrase catalytic domain-containing protein n=1 Tax=Rubroshorea leprosula TaxID=152421 RepID=A0AAV5M4Q0_9ROSI|nr:hypothetical protein SLEP1_g51920 [Rubroshorea leprosula]
MVNTRSVRAGNPSQPFGQGQLPNNLPPQLPPQIPNMFPPVDHAEGGDENQPHNSAHNSASTTNQNVVAAQLAAMQQQFGVFQLVLAQLLARNNLVLEVSSFDQAVGIATVISGLNHERFRDSLLKHPATTFSEVNDRSLKFIIAKEYALSQKPTPFQNQNPYWRDENQNRKQMRTAQNRGSMSTSISRFGRPNSAPPQQSVDHGHTTKQCNSLRSELESLAQKGMLPTSTSTPSQNYTHDYKRIGSRRDELRTKEVICQRGVVTPHNDPLVTSVMINNCQVQRVLVDTGSAPNIMYNHCFESLRLDPALLQRYDGPIYGFNNQSVPVEGVLTLNVAFGSGRTYVTPSVQFLVVKMPSSFNVVIGRPTLTEIRAVVSQSHLCMKFSNPMGIATLRDQPAKNPPPEIHDNRQVMGVEILDNRPKDETRAAPGEDVEETSADMPGIPTSVSQHKLSTNSLKRPVAQKRRLFGGERLKVIKEEVEKLLQAGFVRRVDYCEWVADPVLVKKANGKWRMCINYTNLNQACPKDCYPMPNIDKLVEAASGNERLSLLDAYSGYHQMVTIVFRAQIGRNLEVYVDDIVVKSLKAEDHLTDLEETFNNLRKNRMMLNPEKCIFVVEFEKFLGFMVSRRGIEVNPEKIKAMAEMEPPKLVKDDESGKQKKFEWNSECQAAFDELKSYLSSPPLLTKTNDGEILYLYLDISDEAISSVLIREEGKQQKPVYYTSSVLHGAEIRYSIAEKAALAVVTSARKLRPYFQSHLIIVLTDQPLKQILQKLECSGRLIKWAVELREFEITFQQRSAIRAQALADFIVEYTSAHSDSQPELDNWILYVDGASSNKGSGAGAILLGPEGYRSEHALKFNFDATNNMAKYKALLLGLQLAIELKPAEELTNLVAPWPFAQWGLDLLGPFMKGVGGVTHLIVGVDYFTKWVEARPLSSLTSKKVEDFVFSSIICRYGILYQIVADNGTQFNCFSFRDFCSSYGIKLQFTSVYHLESNGMVESINKVILEGIKPRLELHKARWADELNNVLWAYRTTSRTARGETPYHLAFGTEAVIPIEIGVPSFRVTHFDEGRNGQLFRENLDLLNEVREEARLQSLVYKQKIANFYNKRLAPNWEGPYTIAEVPRPSAYILRDIEGKRVLRVWNVNNKCLYPTGH